MEDLIEKNMGLVLTVVNRFNPKNQYEKEAYIQAGRIGLWKALTKFSINGGSKFSPYAWNPIRWEIIKEIRAMKGKDNFNTLEQYQERLDINSSVPFWELIPSNLTNIEEQIILLRLEGYNLKEISVKLKQQRSYIKKTLDSAINKIRETNQNG